MITKKKGLSFINENEVEEAKEFVRKQLAIASGILDIKLPEPSGYHMYVMIYIRPEEMKPLTDEKGSPLLDENGNQKAIFLPSVVRAEDKYNHCTALVLSQGTEAYQGERFKRSGPWCRVGDWIVFPRNEGTQIIYRGIPMQIIPDDRCLGTVEDPSYITRG
jgi:co-chaperonin GroES (HSP10)